MKLSNCQVGTMVTDGVLVGIIVGLTNNAPSASLRERELIEHAIPLVEWSSGIRHGIHHGNIEVFKD